jgi:hypothetical protein
VSPQLTPEAAALVGNTNLVGAWEWAARGLPVFRLVPGDKVPYAGSRGLLDATLDLATIERWWTETPDANIGVRLDGHLAVDVDTDAAGWRDSLRLWRDNGWPLPPTLTQLTGEHRGRRGFHLIYKAPPGVKFNPHPWPGIDIKVGATGYVVGAPSRHPSGVRYELVWKPPITKPPVAEAPAWLVEHAAKSSTTSLPTRTRSRSRGLAGLLDTFPEREEGQRHDALIEAAGFYAKAMPYRDGFTETMRAVNELLAEPYRGAELEAELRRAADLWDQERAKRQKLVIEDVGVVAARVAAAGEPRFLIDGLWEAGDYGVLGAEWKAGKTWAELDLAVSVASGGKWLGEFQCHQGPVVVFLGEGGERKNIRRLHAICANKGVVLEELPLRVCWRMPRLTDEEHLAELEVELAEHRPELVVLDPFYLGQGRADGRNLALMGDVLGEVQVRCQDAGASLVVVAHWNKTGEGKGAARITGTGLQEWARVIGTASVVDKQTQDDNKTTVTLEWSFEGELPDRFFDMTRVVWADNPTNLGSELHYAVTVERRSSQRGAAEGEQLSDTERRVLGVVTAAEGPVKPSDVHRRLEELAAQGGGGKVPAFRTVQDTMARLHERELLWGPETERGKPRVYVPFAQRPPEQGQLAVADEPDEDPF